MVKYDLKSNIELIFINFQGGGGSKPKKEFRLLVLGLDGAGKTSILKSLANEDINKVVPTHGFNVKTVNSHYKNYVYKFQLKHNNFNLHIWDVGG